MRQFVRKPASWVRRGPNARSDLGEESKARALARSRAKCQITPLIARPDGLLIDGYRTIWGLELEGMLGVELDFILTDEDLTPDQIRVMQANSAFHREPLSDFDKALAMRDTLVANPGHDQETDGRGGIRYRPKPEHALTCHSSIAFRKFRTQRRLGSWCFRLVRDPAFR